MYIHRSFNGAFLSLLLGIGAFFASSLPASATDYFVSRNGSNGDARSWATAWSELNQIDWARITEGDVIYVDGGTTRMVYNTPLIGGPWIHGFTVRAGYHQQHDGQVVIDGQGNQQSWGISMGAGPCSVTARKRSGILVTGWFHGVGLSSPQTNLLKHVEIYGNRRNGVFVNGQNAVVDQCIVHDNGTELIGTANLAANVLFMPVFQAPNNQNIVRNSWIYNSRQDYADGVVDRGTTISTVTNIVRHCVIGPGLRDGYRAETGIGVVADSLLLNASRNSIGFMVHGGGIEKCTTVMTKKNAAGRVHECLYARQGNQNELLIAEQSVFFRGNVNAPADMTHYVNSNKQFQVTGNTMILAPTQEDPHFKQQSIYAFPDNVSLQTLIDTDYSLLSSGPTPPAIGSPITSVKQLLNQYMPSDP